ncbi:hypothetical protein VCRA2113O213_350047 [Vibrio crassostreae]|nr:hypothetical protein VCRA2113O213_350047 [Vibrio crassostreae]
MDALSNYASKLGGANQHQAETGGEMNRAEIMWGNSWHHK